MNAALLRAGLAAALFTSAADAADRWPGVRGPNFDGHAPGETPPDAFPPDGPAVLWARPLGAGYSGFAADATRAVTQYQTLGGQYVLCLDADTGATLWEHRYDGPYDPAGLYPGPRATPTLGGGRVYFAAPSGLVGCLDAATGRPLWSLNPFERFGVEPVDFGYSCGPTLADGKLLVPVGPPAASMVALDPATGRVLWHAGDDPVSHVPALPVTFRGRRLAIGYFRNVLAAFDLATGEPVWRKPLSTGYDEHAAWPVYSEPYLWISGPFRGGSELLELTADPPGVRTVWKSGVLSNDVCSSVLVDGFLYGFDLAEAQAKPHRPSRGAFRCVEFATGEVRWSNGTPNARRRLDDAGPGTPIGQASVLAADGKLVLFNELGELILAAANPDRYEELGRVRVLGGEIGWTPPALCGGRLFVRNHSRAACLLMTPEPTAAPRLTVADIPQTAYRDWAAALIPVEPEYAMDVPTPRQLRDWFVACLGLFATAAVAAGVSPTAFRMLLDRRVSPPLPGERGRGEGMPPATRPAWAFSSSIDDENAQATSETAGEPLTPGPSPQGEGRRARSLIDPARPLRWLLAAAFGATGTTLIGLAAEAFVFTWPLAVFAAFATTASRVRGRSDGTAGAIATDYLVLAAFAGVCLAYFLLCRRLSLATEWVFLAGFPAAVPGLLLARRVRGRRVAEPLAEAAAFAAYYAASAGLLAWKYGG